MASPATCARSCSSAAVTNNVNKCPSLSTAAADAQEHGIRLEVVKRADAKLGFVLLPRRWVVEHSFGWMARFRRLARDYERLPDTLAGPHYLAFTILLRSRFVALLADKSA